MAALPLKGFSDWHIYCNHLDWHFGHCPSSKFIKHTIFLQNTQFLSALSHWGHWWGTNFISTGGWI